MLTKNLNGILLVFILILIFISIYIINLEVKFKPIEQTVTVKETEYQKTLYIGITNYDTIHPLKTNSKDVFYISKLLYKPILDIDRNFQIISGIAQECSKISEKKYILSLNNNLVWNNGEKITAEDIIFTIESIQENKGIYYNNVKNISKINKINETTIEIILNNEQYDFEYMLAIPVIKKEEYNSEIPTTNGMYEIKEINDVSIILENKEEKKGFSNIVIKIYNNPAELYSAINKKEVDIIITENINNSEYVGKIGIVRKKINGRENIFLSLNSNDKMLQKKETRKIIAYAIDKINLNYNIFNNEMIVVDYFMQNDIQLDKFIEYDKSKTIKLLNNKKLFLKVIVDNNDNLKIARDLKKQFKYLGIELEIEQVYNVEENIQKGEYQVAILNREEKLNKDLSIYFNNDLEEINKLIKESNNIENADVSIKKKQEVLNINNEEVYAISLFNLPIYIIHTTDLQGEVLGNWYNIFYNINEWYKNEKK